ncbi:hypothetical protein BDV30DRAFT_211032 [Aspergillus minisclerotigenes]|uniref:Protein kinase domain-containing protein n=1 Tax=Aspergillus minisclerotigenes TaxID=656917 RepID=A0A5N6J4K7_9EURO|nr:hypothetical protein BDV30DRAFT_211032 [Aspergillus minisclerotigenes]
MSEHPADLLVFDPSSLRIGKELKSSEASSIFEVELRGHRYAMKVFHDNGDPGFTRKGRDLNRFRCELNAYRNLHSFGVCEQGHVPYYHGYIDRLDPARFQPHINHFMNDSHAPNAILLEYLEDTEELNCVNYSDDRLQAAIVGLRGIHSALIHHRDVYPKNNLIVRGPPERVVWIDFDVAVTFDSTKPMGDQAEEYCNFEIELVKSFGRLLKEDQRQGLPPNTKYY